MGLPMGVQDPVGAAFRTNKQSSISQHRHDLARRQCCKLRFGAVRQDPLPIRVDRAVRNVAVAAFSAIGAIPSTCEQSPPALQVGDPNAQQSCHFSGLGTGTGGAIKNLLGLAAIGRCG